MDIGFTGNWLDRGDHLRGDAEAMAALQADWRSKLLTLTRGDPAVDPDGQLAWTSLVDADPDAELIFLGLDENGRPHFTQVHADDTPAGGRSMALFRLLETMPASEAAVFGTARVLVDWHARHRFCANCGHGTALHRGGWGRKCGSCATEHFPRVDPVVIMLAEHDGRALLGRGKAWPPRRYSALAGFIEPGESMEEAVAREVFEEAGVRVTNVRYVASQPWPFPGQLMIGAFADAQSDVLTIDTNEIEDAIWVTREEARAALAGEAAPFLPPPKYAIAWTLLNEWVSS